MTTAILRDRLRWFNTVPKRYTLTVLTVSAIVLLRHVLGLYCGFKPPFVFFYAPVMLIALLAEFWPAVLATVISGALADWLFLPSPRLLPTKSEDLIALGSFLAMGAVTCLLAHRFQLRDMRLREFEKVVEGLDEMIAVVDRRHRYVIANQAFLKCRGLTGAQVVGKPVDEVLDQHLVVANIEEKLDQAFRNEVVQFEMTYPSPLLGDREVSVSYLPIQGRKGVDRVVCVAQDVTERNRSEALLRKSEEHFRILVEQAPEGIFIADSEGRYLDVNSTGAQMLGYTRDEILHLSIADIVVPEEVPRVPDERNRMVAGHCVRNEWKFLRKDGSTFYGEVYGRALPDGRLQGILVDITERKRAEETVRQNEERFRVSLKGSPITVFNQDLDLRYTWVYNPHLYWQQDVLGKTDDEVLGEDKARYLRELKQRVLETRTSVREDVVIGHNGTNYSFDVTIEPLLNAEGQVIGITGASMDIARLRELADSLHEAKEKLVREKSYLEGQIQSELGFEQIIGQSPALREVLRKARVVAPTDSTVLLLGETGTGKELVARSVRSLSSRPDKSFIKLNCAAVPTGLLESELFGHEKGAFTGAVGLKVGRLELADKGTLFLDEVGELPLELQPKLLRVLQDREFERLGGVRTLHVDVRIISATNRDLRREVAEKRFREDLFYRLNVFPIELPALRERRSDIPMLVRHFVHKHAARMAKAIEVIPDETMSILESWNWPGNVRELENVIERMVILTKTRVLAPPPAELIDQQGPALDSFSKMEREYIIRVLRETHGVISGADGAADRLGLKRTTLQSMLKRFNIHAHEYRRTNGL